MAIIKQVCVHLSKDELLHPDQVAEQEVEFSHQKQCRDVALEKLLGVAKNHFFQDTEIADDQIPIIKFKSRGSQLNSNVRLRNHLQIMIPYSKSCNSSMVILLKHLDHDCFLAWVEVIAYHPLDQEKSHLELLYETQVA